MYALNVLTVFVMLSMTILVAGTIADKWPSRRAVETWLDGYFSRAVLTIWANAAEENRDFGPDADPATLKRGERAERLYWRVERTLRRLGIAYPNPSVCESCGLVWSASDMTIHEGQWEVCPDCENESTRQRTLFWLLRDHAKRS
jgi:hypothetical protein